jgi:hypothetical protein
LHDRIVPRDMFGETRHHGAPERRGNIDSPIELLQRPVVAIDGFKRQRQAVLPVGQRLQAVPQRRVERQPLLPQLPQIGICQDDVVEDIMKDQIGIYRCEPDRSLREGRSNRSDCAGQARRPASPD